MWFWSRVRVADVVTMGRAEFDALVERALAQVPGELAALVENCVFVVEDDAPDEEPHLLGLYDGVPLTERDTSYAAVLPDRIVVFMNPTLAICETAEDVVAEVGVTVVHEIAHHFGIDDERLHALGWA